MIKRFPGSQLILSARLASLTKIAFIAALALNVLANPSLAADPFRTSHPRNISNTTEAAFKAIFQQGDYQAADRYLQQALSSDPNEPLIYAMKASLSYANKDISSFDTYSKKTIETAQKLIPKDPLRGNLYTAVGHFLTGAVIISREGTVSGAPQALSQLREVYQDLDKAEAISKNDPELNLLKGYMDLMVAVNLPFASPQQAIERLEKNAAPPYLADRGIAIGYRDLKQYTQALDYTNRALKMTSDNPELYYLKAQILREQSRKEKNQQLLQEAIANFDKALVKKSQLPTGLVKQIEHERGSASNSLSAG
ncbi:MAG: Sll0314/Alr1548 family TPR repeat-containing protein [Rhizonema sp. PD38]|nr:Sll0314/Alr1548 family TPR repeat-containing protein [Rhizonema sp. PD38]